MTILERHMTYIADLSLRGTSHERQKTIDGVYIKLTGWYKFVDDVMYVQVDDFDNQSILQWISEYAFLDNESHYTCKDTYDNYSSCIN